MPKPQWETGVYKIVNTVNGKIYVGGAYKDFTNRFRIHVNALNEGKHYNRYLQRAWNKHGNAAFKFVIIERCKPADVGARELHWLSLLRPFDQSIGYNLSVKAGGGKGGMHYSRKEKEARRQRMLGNQHLAGHQHSDDTKSKISLALKRHECSPLCRQKSSERMIERNTANPPRKGKKCSDEHKQKLSEAAKRRGKKCT